LLPFDYRTATAEEIETQARALVGKWLIDIDPTAPMVPSSARTKGTVGRIFETAFGIPANSVPGPDFPSAGIELKSVPIQVIRGESRAKERISVGMIDFQRLASETWDTATVRRKLDHLLLIFYGWEPLQPIARFQTLCAGIWRPDESTLSGIRSDWETIANLARGGRRDEVSESLTSILGAATKGRGHGSTTRAWSLKQPFVSWLYGLTRGTESAPIATADPDPAAAFEAHILGLLRPHVGIAFDELARVVDRPELSGKAATSHIVRALVGEHPRGRHGDFERFGVETKVVPVNARGQIVERMSFPAFIHEEIGFEEWESSDLLGRLNRLLIIPVRREKRAPLAETTLGRPFFWSPSETELQGIAAEWTMYRDLIMAGNSDRLPTAAATRYVHVRTHGRDSRDRELAPGGHEVTKKSFWLNDRFLATILREHGAA
jgi:DNA mismatch repair protein MutH